MKKEGVIGIVVVVVVILAVIFIVSNKPVEKEFMTEEDFQIVSISWNEDVKWDSMCDPEIIALTDRDKLTAGYIILTQQNEDTLSCNYWINGVPQRNEDQNLGQVYWGFEREQRTHEGSYNVDYTRDNEITICCKSNGDKEGEDCDSVTLKKRC